MNLTKAAYWIALGAFALGMTSEYQNGSFPAMNRVAARAEAVLCQVAARAERTVAMARLLTNRPSEGDFSFDDQLVARRQAQIDRAMAIQQAHLDRAMALRQANLDCAHAKLDQLRAELDRAQAVRVQALERTRVKLADVANRRMIVVCPKTGAKIVVNAGPGAEDLPNLDVQ